MIYEELQHIKADRKLRIMHRINSKATDTARFVRWSVTKTGEHLAVVQRFDVWGNRWLNPVRIRCTEILEVF